MKITTPKAILRALDHDGLQQPEIKTLSNYLAIIRKNNYGPAQINVRDLELWHQNRKEFPNDYEFIIKISSSNGGIFYSHQDLNLRLTKEIVEDYILAKQNLSWRTFNDYSQICQINETILCSDDWKQSKCNCREFAKHYICIHVLGLAYRYKLCIIPEEAKTISIGQKPKRGRPKKIRIEKEYFNEATVQATVEATVDLPKKRGRPKKSTTQGKKTKIN